MSRSTTKAKKTCASSEDSDQPGHQSLPCPAEECYGPLTTKKRTTKTDQIGRMPRLI